MGFGSILLDLRISNESQSKGWILAVVCSQGSSFSIEANCLSKYFYGVKDGFGNTLKGFKNCFEVIPKDEESLIGLI